jgi:hypothetical protein
MADLVKVREGNGEAATGLMAALLILVGCLLTIGGCIYHVFIHPEWTSGQAFGALWPFLATGMVSLVLGWLVDRAPGAPWLPAQAARVRAVIRRLA